MGSWERPMRALGAIKGTHGRDRPARQSPRAGSGRARPHPRGARAPLGQSHERGCQSRVQRRAPQTTTDLSRSKPPTSRGRDHARPPGRAERSRHPLDASAAGSPRSGASSEPFCSPAPFSWHDLMIAKTTTARSRARIFTPAFLSPVVTQCSGGGGGGASLRPDASVGSAPGALFFFFFFGAGCSDDD